MAIDPQGESEKSFWDTHGATLDRRGIYNNDYFSGAQVAIYIGDVLIDEVTSMSYAVTQSRTPLYGYASRLFDAVAEGNVIVQGQFTINFKEAGYLWLVLQRYKALVKGEFTPFSAVKSDKGKYIGEETVTANIEKVINGNLGLPVDQLQELAAHASLTGFSSSQRAAGKVGRAENAFEMFENRVWGAPKKENIGSITVDTGMGRHVDDPALNPFDIYVAFGDYVGDDNIHHTVQKLEDVYILGQSKQVAIDGLPIQEAYSFIARDLL